MIDFDDRKEREITINFPLFTEVCELYIGLQKGCKLEPASEYTHQKPVVYYGSSITNGGCASRPGNTYQAVISRMLDCDFVNLGFNGNAKGEQEIADYIKGLDMSVFVYDYDHNAPTPEHLLDTHEKMFKAIKKDPDADGVFCNSSAVDSKLHPLGFSLWRMREFSGAMQKKFISLQLF